MSWRVAHIVRFGGEAVVRRRGRCLPLLVLIAAALASPSARGDVATDGTMGRRTALSGPDYRIGAKLGQRRGGNLFHSFERFSIKQGESATFTGPAKVRNVISRVTGGTRSDIDGALRSRIRGANVWFFNPAGVAFGPNAEIDVEGGFHVSTGDELRFKDGRRFAVGDGDSQLTVAAPQAFGFLGDNPAGVSVDRSRLDVLPGHDLSLSAGSITVTGDGSGGAGRLAAQGGRIALETHAQPSAKGAVRISRGTVDASGNGAGAVAVRTGKLAITGGRIATNNSGALPAARDAGIEIDADTVRLRAGARVESVALSGGDASPVSVNARELTLEGGSEIRSSTGSGDPGAPAATSNAGRVAVNVAETLTIHGVGRERLTGISSSVEPGARGKGGRIQVKADTIELRDGGTIRSASFGTGDAGPVEVNARRIDLLDGGQIASGTRPPSIGRGGRVTVDIGESLTIEGQLDELDPARGVFPPSGIFASSESGEGAGDAGRVLVRAPLIRISNRGEIASESFGDGDAGAVAIKADVIDVDDGEITTRTESAGVGGDVVVDAATITVRNQGQIRSDTEGEGDGGRLDLKVRGPLEITTEGQVTARSIGAGDAGEIAIEARMVELTREAAISASATGGGAPGAIRIVADTVIIDGTTARILGEGAPGIQSQTIGDSTTLTGGMVEVHADRLDLRAGGAISTDTESGGRGGSILIRVHRLLVDGGLSNGNQIVTPITTSVDAKATGDGGEIRIEADEVELREAGAIFSMTQGGGNAGAVEVHAGRLQLRDGGQIGSGTRPVENADQPRKVGAGGKIRVFAKRLEISGTSAVPNPETGTLPPSGIFASSESEAPDSGPGGRVHVAAPVISLADGGEIASETRNAAPGGDVRVIAPEQLTIANGAEITTRGERRGDAGNIEVRAGVLRVTDGGLIRSSSARAGGGRVGIEVGRYIDLLHSKIITEVARAKGNAGNVDIRPRVLVAQGSTIDASADEGGGGTVTIRGIRIEADSTVDVSSVAGLAGAVITEGPEADLAGDLSELPDTFLAPVRILDRRCAERSGAVLSRLVNEGGAAGLMEFGAAPFYLAETSPLDEAAPSFAEPLEAGAQAALDDPAPEGCSG